MTEQNGVERSSGDLTGFGIGYFDFDESHRYVRTATEVSSDNSAFMRNIRRHENALRSPISESVSALGNLSGVRSMCYTFSSCAFTTIDFRGFDPSTLMDLLYTFSGRSRLTTILADANWALPSSGLMGSQCFYSCPTSFVGGNGTTWASNKTAYTYFRIDTASTPGYITAA